LKPGFQVFTSTVDAIDDNRWCYDLAAAFAECLLLANKWFFHIRLFLHYLACLHVDSLPLLYAPTDYGNHDVVVRN